MLRSHPIGLSVATRNFGSAGLPIADGYEVAESPGNTGFFAEKLCVSDGSWVYCAALPGTSKKFVSKGVVKRQSTRIIRDLGREADLFTRQAAIIGDQRLQSQTH